jgi:CDP-diacylglycerol--serine O-phosphatidyltransferase
MDPIVPRLEEETRRRRSRRMFRRDQVPVRLMVPNLFTLAGLAAGLTAIRMAIDGRFDLALYLIVFAALLDGVDGRVARMLKASSRFGAELDSLADFVNFGVAPAIVIFIWGNWPTPGLKGLAWIVVVLLAMASCLRLARFNSALDEERPKWQSNFFTGVPAPAGAILALLPVYLEGVGLTEVRAGAALVGVLAYTLLIAVLMVSTIPTFSGKLLGERVRREWVLPLFVLVGALFAMLVTYPFATLTVGSLVYLALIPLSFGRFRRHARSAGAPPGEAAPQSGAPPAPAAPAPTQTRVVPLRGEDGRR